MLLQSYNSGVYFCLTHNIFVVLVSENEETISVIYVTRFEKRGNLEQKKQTITGAVCG
jgi:hypothetical protein